MTYLNMTYELKSSQFLDHYFIATLSLYIYYLTWTNYSHSPSVHCPFLTWVTKGSLFVHLIDFVRETLPNPLIGNVCGLHGSSVLLVDCWVDVVYPISLANRAYWFCRQKTSEHCWIYFHFKPDVIIYDGFGKPFQKRAMPTSNTNEWLVNQSIKH